MDGVSVEVLALWLIPVRLFVSGSGIFQDRHRNTVVNRIFLKLHLPTSVENEEMFVFQRYSHFRQVAEVQFKLHR